MRGALIVLAAYMTAVAVPLAIGTEGPTVWMLVIHSALLLLVFRRLQRAGSDASWWAFLPLCCGPVLYLEVPTLLRALHRPRFDGVVQGWELAIFHAQVSQHLAERWHYVWFSEAVHLCYLSYYALLVVPVAYFWFRGELTALHSAVTALVTVFVLCFVCYLAFPVDGPRFLFGPAHAPNGPVRALVVALLQAGSSSGTAFPSSHVAASLTVSLSTLRYNRRLGLAALAITTGLVVGAVYGGYHYAIDVVWGAVASIVALAIARRLERLDWRSVDSPPPVLLEPSSA